VYNNVFRSDWTVSADVNYRPTRRWLVYANASRALRLPNYTELYYQSKTQVADSKLQPEHAVKAEIGAEYKYQSWNVGVAAFYRYGTNTIDWIKYLDSEDERWFSRQLTNLHTVGGSLTAAFCPQKPASGFLKQLRLHYTYMYMDKPHKVSQGEFLSKYALDHLSHHASLTLDHVIYRSVGACWQLTVQDRHGSYLNRDGNVADYHTVWLLGGKVYYDHHLFSLSLECTNMLNRLYYDIGGIEQPRHWVSASVVVHL
jgi:iron complex outermembrane receptor protein